MGVQNLPQTLPSVRHPVSLLILLVLSPHSRGEDTNSRATGLSAGSVRTLEVAVSRSPRSHAGTRAGVVESQLSGIFLGRGVSPGPFLVPLVSNSELQRDFQLWPSTFTCRAAVSPPRSPTWRHGRLQATSFKWLQIRAQDLDHSSPYSQPPATPCYLEPFSLEQKAFTVCPTTTSPSCHYSSLACRGVGSCICLHLRSLSLAELTRPFKP